jgi:hypothetical protein
VEGTGFYYPRNSIFSLRRAMYKRTFAAKRAFSGLSYYVESRTRFSATRQIDAIKALGSALKRAAQSVDPRHPVTALLISSHCFALPFGFGYERARHLRCRPSATAAIHVSRSEEKLEGQAR